MSRYEDIMTLTGDRRLWYAYMSLAFVTHTFIPSDVLLQILIARGRSTLLLISRSIFRWSPQLS